MADKKQIISVVKKNAVSIGAGVVALAAVAVAFAFPPGWLAATKAEIDQRASVGHEVSSIANKSRKLPQLNLDANAEVGELKFFPNEDATKAGEEAINALKKQVDEVVRESNELGNHKQLVPNLFGPNRIDQGLAFQFRDEYGKFMPAGLNAICNAAVPPLAVDIATAVNNEKARISATMPVKGPGGTSINEAEVQAALAGADAAISQKLRDEAAATHAVYVNVDTWSAYPGIDSASGAQPKDSDLWLAQLGLWIQSDIAAAVAETNAGSKSVITSPVKHIVKVTLAPNPYVIVRGSTDTSVPVTGINAAAAVALNRNYGVTGHTANAMYDVCRYEMIVRVSESHVAEFLAQIPHGRLHYVLDVDLRTVDSNVEASVGSLSYGRDPIVEIAIQGEALFLRKAVENIMPKTVKQIVGIEPAPAPTVGG